MFPDADSLQAHFFPQPLDLGELPTPCLLLDEARYVRNAARIAELCRERQVVLRPHLKTCRCWQVAQSLLDGPASPCTVATMGEAEAMAALGARDILLAVGIRPSLFARAAALLRAGVAFTVVLDSLAMARALADFAKEDGTTFRVLLEVDCDGHRAGLAPTDPQLVQIADLLASHGQDVAGVLTHAGAAYNCQSVDAIRALADQEAQAALAAAATLRAAGFAAPVVSIGSTPTLVHGKAYAGISEVRSGVFVYMDLVQEGLGVCSTDDVALSVLASVIGGFPVAGASSGRLLVDAGWAALSSDAGLSWRFAAQGYGLVCDAAGNLLPGLSVRDLNQEHGMVGLAQDAAPSPQTADFLARMSPATRVRILPNHACATAMMHRAMYLVRDNRAVARLPLFGGW